MVANILPYGYLQTCNEYKALKFLYDRDYEALPTVVLDAIYASNNWNIITSLSENNFIQPKRDCWIITEKGKEKVEEVFNIKTVSTGTEESPCDIAVKEYRANVNISDNPCHEVIIPNNWVDEDLTLQVIKKYNLKKKGKPKTMTLLKINAKTELLILENVLGIEPEIEKKDNTKTIDKLKTEVADKEKELKDLLDKKQGINGNTSISLLSILKLSTFINGNKDAEKLISYVSTTEKEIEALKEDYTGRIRYKITYDHPIQNKQVIYYTDWFKDEKEADEFLEKLNPISVKLNNKK